jgi:carnitine O-acetyltransferase
LHQSIFLPGYASTLPKLPVPPLQQTIDKFLRLAQPLVTPDQFAHTKQVRVGIEVFISSDNHLQLTKEFVVNGDGLQLQSLLEDRAKQMPNWVNQRYDDHDCHISI